MLLPTQQFNHQQINTTLNQHQTSAFSNLVYRPKIQINFGKDNKFHIYHSEGGERFITNLTRLNMIFIAGNSLLLLLEVLSPFFGYWHGVSLSMTLMFSLIGSFMIQHYSTRMINNIYILPDGQHIEIEYFNAFWIPKKEKLRVVNFGYLAPSRIFNLDMATYQQKSKVYVNLSRNLYKHPEFNEIVQKLLNGQELTFFNQSMFESKTISQTTNEKDMDKVLGKVVKAKKKKWY
eukprot:403371013